MRNYLLPTFITVIRLYIDNVIQLLSPQQRRRTFYNSGSLVYIAIQIYEKRHFYDLYRVSGFKKKLFWNDIIPRSSHDFPFIRKQNFSNRLQRPLHSRKSVREKGARCSSKRVSQILYRKPHLQPSQPLSSSSLSPDSFLVFTLSPLFNHANHSRLLSHSPVPYTNILPLSLLSFPFLARISFSVSLLSLMNAPLYRPLFSHLPTLLLIYHSHPTPLI